MKLVTLSLSNGSIKMSLRAIRRIAWQSQTMTGFCLLQNPFSFTGFANAALRYASCPAFGPVAKIKKYIKIMSVLSVYTAMGL